MTMIMMPAAKGVQAISENDNASEASQAYRQYSLIPTKLNSTLFHSHRCTLQRS